MTNRDLVVIGGSAGATGPLKMILQALPADLPAALAIVLHIPSNSTGIFTLVASAAASLPVQPAQDGAALERGTIYLAPPDRHLLIIDGRIRLGNGPRENLVRPAIDPLFRSAALSAGPRVVGVILSGMLNDGASGLAAVKSCGGIALVQSPQDAEAREMPLAALEATPVDLSAHARDIAAAIIRHVGEPPDPAHPCPPALRLDVEIAAGGRIPPEEFATMATPSALTCPHCSGVLSEIKHGHPLRYRCQVGHAFTARSLLEVQEGRADEAMRIALRIIEERAELVGRMGRDALQAGRQTMAEMYEQRAAEYRGYAESLRQAVIERMQGADLLEEFERLAGAQAHGRGEVDGL